MRYSFVFALCTLLFYSDLPAQAFYKQSHADSLKLELASLENEEHVRVLLLLADCYHEIQLDSALSYTRKAIHSSDLLDFEWGRMKGRYELARYQTHNTRLTEAMQSLEPCIPWFEKHGFDEDALLCRILNIWCLSFYAPQTESLKSAEAAMQKAKALGDPLLTGMVWDQFYGIDAGQLAGVDYPDLLDSSQFYFNQAGNALWIMSGEFEKIRTGAFNPRGSIRSLSKLLDKAQAWGTRSIQHRLYSFMSKSYASLDLIDSALYYNARHMELCKAFGSKDELAHACLRKGFFLIIGEELEGRLEALQQGFELYASLENLHGQYTSVKWVGGEHERSGDFALAIESYIEALEVARRLEDVHYEHYTKASLANIYRQTNETEKAASMFLEVLDFVDEELTGRLRLKMIAKTSESLGLVYHQSGDHELALQYLDTAVALFKKVQIAILPRLYGERMAIHLEVNDLLSANENYELLQAELETQNTKGEHMLQLYIGRLKYELGAYTEAIAALEEFIARSGGVAYNEKSRLAHELLYRSHIAQKHFEKALDYHVVLKAIDDSLQSSRASENIELLKTEFELSEAEAGIVKLEQEKELKDLLMERKNTEIALGRLYITLLIVCLLLAAGVFYWFYQRLRWKKQQRELEIQREKWMVEKKSVKAEQQAELARAKNALLANVSHEFRTPLTLIQVPLQQHLKSVDVKHQGMIRSVLNNTDELLEMVDEILEMSKIESGHTILKKTDFSLSLLCSQVKASFDPVFARKSIEFELEHSLGNVSIHADRHRLIMVVNNLLKNAASHTPAGGRVRLLIHSDEHIDDRIHIRVSNTGKMIPEEEQQRVFDRYYRADDIRYNGHGIGLALTRQIVELHGGEIEVASSEGDETVFHLHFPTTISEDLPSHSIQSAATPLEASDVLQSQKQNSDLVTQPHVLVVEDNAKMRALLEDVLANDFRLSFAEDGARGIELAKELQPDLIVSDVMMPNVNGMELLKALKTNIETSHVPILLLTALADAENRVQGFEEDADDYISKPFDANELRARIWNLLRQRRHLQKLFFQNPLLIQAESNYSPLDADFLKRASEVVEANYERGEFGVPEFCAELALNRNSVHNKLKALTGQSASQFIKSYRLAKASEMLITTEASIISIGERSGFNSPQAFNKAFRALFGLTPSAFRKSKQTGVKLEE